MRGRDGLVVIHSAAGAKSPGFNSAVARAYLKFNSHGRGFAGASPGRSRAEPGRSRAERGQSRGGAGAEPERSGGRAGAEPGRSRGGAGAEPERGVSSNIFAFLFFVVALAPLVLESTIECRLSVTELPDHIIF